MVKTISFCYGNMSHAKRQHVSSFVKHQSTEKAIICPHLKINYFKFLDLVIFELEYICSHLVRIRTSSYVCMLCLFVCYYNKMKISVQEVYRRKDRQHEDFFLRTFKTNSWELDFLEFFITKFLVTYFLELTGRLLIYCWHLEFSLHISDSIYISRLL